MDNILTSPFVKELIELTKNMYRLGWDERNGGNVSYILSPNEVSPYLDINNIIRIINLDFNAEVLANKIFLITGTGKYFKNISDDPETNLGIIKVNPCGRSLSLLWGLKDGSRPTSELATHFAVHAKRLMIDPGHRVVIHTHATNLIAMTFIHDLDEKEFTKTLWKMNTECIVVFPDGISVLPWMICGNEEIGIKTAKSLEHSRLVIWAMHGVVGTGGSFDECFGLIETAEKAAEIYFKIAGLERKKEITDEELKSLSIVFNVIPRPGYLD